LCHVLGQIFCEEFLGAPVLAGLVECLQNPHNIVLAFLDLNILQENMQVFQDTQSHFVVCIFEEFVLNINKIRVGDGWAEDSRQLVDRAGEGLLGLGVLHLSQF
jgi:hypothetical protein